MPLLDFKAHLIMRYLILTFVAALALSSCSEENTGQAAEESGSQPVATEEVKDSVQVDPLLLEHLNPDLKPFYHGVASGDPTNSAVVIWTRVTPSFKASEVSVDWEVSRTPDFSVTLQEGTFRTGPERDYTVKVDVKDLEAGQHYYYRFKAEEQYSLVGETNTLPQDPEEMRIAFASCSNYEWGYFNAYAAMAADEDIDLVVHLGDYIYEYAVGVYGDTSLGRFNVPDKEITALQDYRTRYSLYRLDPDLQAAHQKKAIYHDLG